MKIWELEANCERSINRKAKGFSGYILAPGCKAPNIVPAEKIDWLMDLANQVGEFN
jgi:uroporphyrinogen-III decarboxylase